jgi:ATP/maltotriose-dependent transcriptional regulator MalT
VAQCDAIGSGILHTAFLGNLAEALWQTGRRPEAWEMLNQALARNDRHEQRAFEVELKCRRARFLLDESLANAAEAEAALRDAVSVARRQKGRIPELRASMLLAKLLASSGRAAEGRRLVETVYAAFTEGADAPDLVAAREFLATPS